MDLTPALTQFDEIYQAGTAPWVIGEPQRAVVELEQAGLIRGTVLDAGCGTGEHTIHLARLGYDVLGIDGAPAAVARARANAAARGVSARFEVADALSLGGEPRYDTVLDTGLFHIFDDTDRARYVRSLRGVCRPGGVVHVFALSDAEPGPGPRISDTVIRDAFSNGEWELEQLHPSRFRGVITEQVAAESDTDLPIGTVIDVAAWHAQIRRRFPAHSG